MKRQGEGRGRERRKESGRDQCQTVSYSLAAGRQTVAPHTSFGRDKSRYRVCKFDAAKQCRRT